MNVSCTIYIGLTPSRYKINMKKEYQQNPGSLSKIANEDVKVVVCS